MEAQHIRAVAICVFSRGDDILAVEAFDEVKSETFYRPLGGGIAFGESSELAVRREVREEIGADIVGLRLLGTLENIFVYNGTPGHEIVQVYGGRLGDETLYAAVSIPGFESDGAPFRAVWKSLGSFSERCPLYPAGLVELLRRSSHDENAKREAATKAA
jgi:8-oxo-dGTP pyrophosphatase MutT (NUDIX family)